MNAARTKSEKDMSPQLAARFTGLLYLILVAAAPFSQVYVRSSAIVRGDAAATAQNILASEQMWRFAAAADFATILADVAIAYMLYRLLAPAGKGVALLAAFFRLAMSAVMAVNIVLHMTPLILLKDAPYWAAFTTEQTQALAMLSLRMHTVTYSVALIFFAGHCLLVGFLIARATFLPRALGALLMIAGVSYAIDVLASLTFSTSLFPYTMIAPGIAELSLTLWLLIMGINADKWREQPGAVRDGARTG
jgi:hypothetical protein